MPFRDPLTIETLRAIRERQVWNPDVMTLLWEIKRLRSMVLRTNQLWPDFKRPTGVLAPIYDSFEESLKIEPCVIERDQMAAELLNAPAKPRKGMDRR